MRKVLSISLPDELAVKLNKEIKDHHHGTASSFIRRLINKYFDEKEERHYLLKERSNQLLKEVIKNTKTDQD